MPSALATRPFRIPLLAALTALLALCAAFSNSERAEARGVWCSGDPTILVNGSLVSITVHVPADRMRDLKHVEVIFHVPSDASVQLLLNDSLLVPAKTSYVKDQPPTGKGLLKGTKVLVEVKAIHKGPPMPIAATSIAIGKGTKVWTEGMSDKPLFVQTQGLLNLKLF